MMYMADAVSLVVLGKGLMVGIGFFGPAIGIGLIGSSYFQAVGRNPENCKVVWSNVGFRSSC